LKNKLFFIIACTCLVSANCTTNDDDTSTPVISTTLPADNQVYNSGDAVLIKGSMTDNHLHEGKISIMNNAGGPDLFSKSISIHGQTSYTINESYTPVVAVVVNATVKLEVKDLAGNYVERKIAIRINP
jgi:hypothetical protein